MNDGMTACSAAHPRSCRAVTGPRAALHSPDIRSSTSHLRDEACPEVWSRKTPHPDPLAKTGRGDRTSLPEDGERGCARDGHGHGHGHGHGPTGHGPRPSVYCDGPPSTLAVHGEEESTSSPPSTTSLPPQDLADRLSAMLTKLIRSAEAESR